MHVNNGFQKESNISKVFEMVWRTRSISRVDISKKFNIYRSTVSNIINTLLDNQVIVEGEPRTDTDKTGRKPIVLSVNDRYGCICGIELQQDYYNICLISFDGEVLWTSGGNTPYDADHMETPESTFINILDSIISIGQDKVKEFNLPLLGICVGLPGIINVDKGIITYTQPFNLKDFDYREKLGKRYGCIFVMENDARCCAWLECAQSKAENRDFLCVLARNHIVKDKNNNPYPIQNGIGIGLSMAMNGKIMYGHNYAFGEYISNSWTIHRKGQTGLPEAVINTIDTVEDSYREWIKDLFSTLSVLVPVLAPGSVILHGQPQEKKDFILKVIAEDVPQFDYLIRQTGSTFFVMDADEYTISKGAAYMFIQRLFEIPSVDEAESYSRISWENLFEVRHKNLGNCQ